MSTKGKVINKVKNFFTEENVDDKPIKIWPHVVRFLIIVLVLLLANYEWPYYIDTPGGLDNLNNRITVEGAYDVKGSINMTYVSELRATTPLLLYAKINKDWKVFSKTENNVGILDYEATLEREKVLMKQSYTTAIYYAYKKANKTVNITNEKVYIIYVFKESNTDLKVGDQIIDIDGVKINSIEEVHKFVATKNESDTSVATVINNGKEYKRNIKYIKEEDRVLIGVELAQELQLDTSPNYSFNFSEREYGPSGGLMVSLAVYNSLVEKDITGGYAIAGTGALDMDGNVGLVGGIELKIIGAAKKGAKVFFAPSKENYEEALKIKKERNLKIDVVEVKTFDDALNYLENNMNEK